MIIMVYRKKVKVAGVWAPSLFGQGATKGLYVTSIRVLH